MSRPDDYSCAEVLALTDDYLDEELTPHQTRAVEEHLAGCATCSAAIEMERALFDGLRQRVHDVCMPAEARDRLWSSLRQAAAALSADASNKGRPAS